MSNNQTSEMPKATVMTEYEQFEHWYMESMADYQVYPSKRFANRPSTRYCLMTCSSCACLPCFLYSGLVRIFLIPCTCGSSIGGTPLTKSSDKCITTCCDSIDHKNQHINADIFQGLTWVKATPDATIQEKRKAVFTTMTNLIKSDKIDMYYKYKLVDHITNAAKTLGFEVPTNITPSNAHMVVKDMGLV